MPFSPGFAPNVVCRYAGTAGTSDTVLTLGHYDSRCSFGMERSFHQQGLIQLHDPNI
ncbi:hypothetical protein ID866_10942, partial [Astraeus odoratus]